MDKNGWDEPGRHTLSKYFPTRSIQTFLVYYLNPFDQNHCHQSLLPEGGFGHRKICFEFLEENWNDTPHSKKRTATDLGFLQQLEISRRFKETQGCSTAFLTGVISISQGKLVDSPPNNYPWGIIFSSKVPEYYLGGGQ